MANTIFGINSILGLTSLQFSSSLQLSGDADVTTYITAVEGTGYTMADYEKTAIDNLVNSLKTNSLWTPLLIIYPITGNTADSQKFNLKDPRDLDAAYRLLYSYTGDSSTNSAIYPTVASTYTATNKTVLHASTGMTCVRDGDALPNGGSYINTSFVPSGSGLTDISHHMSFYSRTQSNSTAMSDIGCTSTSGGWNMRIKYDGTNRYADDMNASTRISIADAAGSTQGLFTLSRTSTSSCVWYRNSTSIGSMAITGGTLPSTKLTIGALNNFVSGGDPYNVQVSDRECAFVSVGMGLTSTQVSTLYTIVQQYQSDLSRNV